MAAKLFGCGTSLGYGPAGDQNLRLAVRGCAPPVCQKASLMLAIHPQARTTPAVCAEIAQLPESSGVRHRKTRPYTPKTNGKVERFNDRVQREVLGIVIYSHADLEIVLRGFNATYSGRRQRVLKGLSPETVLCQRLEADPALASPTFRPPSPNLNKRALRIVAGAKEVSQSDS